MKTARITALLATAFLIAACGGGGNASGSQPPPPPTSFAYSAPQQTGDGWATGHLDDHGFDSALIFDMMDEIVSGRVSGIDSVTIVRNGTLLLDVPLRDSSSLDFFDDWIGNTDPLRHIMHSTSKSVTSALVGIAIDQGYIASLDTPFYDLFPYGSYDNPDPRKAQMTLEDALTMRLGLTWDEWSEPYGSALNDLQILTVSNDDYAKALLDLPMESDPGTTFTYNTAATIAIGQAVQNSVGVPLDIFAELNLFQPLQILQADWVETPTGLANGGSGLFLKPRDMAKFGQLFISGGVWNGQQIISSEWTTQSVTRFVGLSWTWTSGYGYQWWVDNFSFEGQPIDSWSTRGYGGQYIFCVPSLELVVTFTAQNYMGGSDIAFSLMQDYVLPALESTT